jgi:hypothetical protein
VRIWENIVVSRLQTSSAAPYWDDGDQAAIAYATPQQKRFYYHFVQEISNGRLIDINGNINYLLVFLQSTVQRFISDKNLKGLLADFEKFSAAYGSHERLQFFLSLWKADAYLYLGNYDLAWSCIRQMYFNIQDVLDIRSKCNETSVSGADLFKLTGAKETLTDFGKNNFDSVLMIISKFLDNFHDKHRRNFIEHFCNQFDFATLNDVDLEKLREFYCDDRDFAERKLRYQLLEQKNYREREKYIHYFRRSIPFPYVSMPLYDGSSIEHPSFPSQPVPSIIQYAAENECRRIIREAENTLRDEMSVPRIGEGWVSETELFYKLCERFPTEKVINHARPTWLGPQHLDIYFPKRNIGIEYQGVQHQYPVEYFGGETGFNEQKERDERKRRLCEENKCRLIYVFPGYDFEEISREITSSFIRVEI